MTQVSDIQLIQGDCLEEMDILIDKGVKVDLTVTSPPYDNLRIYKNSLIWNEIVWKNVIDKLFIITKDGGVVVWIVGDATINGSETGTSFKQALYFKEIGFNLHDTMIYASEKPPLTHNRYEQKFEYMFILSKWKPKKFNPILEKCVYAGSILDRPETYKGSRGENSAIRTRRTMGIVKQNKIKGNIWWYKTGGHHSTTYKKAFEHPAIFPEQLANDHIISWSNEGDTVFDPFMGSGTTAVACLNINRNFIGIELNEDYFEIAKNRIDNHVMKSKLF